MDPRGRECRLAAVRVRVGDLEGLGSLGVGVVDTSERAAGGCEEDTGVEGGRRPGPEWDARQDEWVGREAEGGVESGRYRQDCPSPNEVSSGQARPDQPSLHIANRRDPLRPCGYV